MSKLTPPALVSDRSKERVGLGKVESIITVVNVEFIITVVNVEPTGTVFIDVFVQTALLKVP